MKRTIAVTMMAAVVLLSQTGALFAATTSKSFNLTATVQPSSSISVSASRVNSDGSFTSQSSTTLSFDTMTFNSTLGVFTTDHGFAIDVAAAGAGSVTTVVTYVEGAKPTGALKGLGGAAFATFVKAVNSTTPEVKIVAKALTGLNQTITPAQVAGGYLRTYLGISTGDTTEPTGVAPFTALDKTGAYDGTITFTVTVA